MTSSLTVLRGLELRGSLVSVLYCVLRFPRLQLFPTGYKTLLSDLRSVEEVIDYDEDPSELLELR